MNVVIRGSIPAPLLGAFGRFVAGQEEGVFYRFMTKRPTCSSHGVYAGFRLTWLVVTVGFLLVTGRATAQLVRQANSTLKLPANPPTTGYALTDAFPSLTFSGPIAVATPP